MPLILVSFTAFVWILAPILFQPPTKAVYEQVRELVSFIAKSPSIHDRIASGKASSLYEAALEQELKQANRSLALPMLSSILICALYLFMTTSNIFDQTWAPLCGMFILFLFRSVVRFSGIKSAGMIVIAIPCLSLLLECKFITATINETKQIHESLLCSFLGALIVASRNVLHSKVCRFRLHFHCGDSAEFQSDGSDPFSVSFN